MGATLSIVPVDEFNLHAVRAHATRISEPEERRRADERVREAEAAIAKIPAAARSRSRRAKHTDLLKALEVVAEATGASSLVAISGVQASLSLPDPQRRPGHGGPSFSVNMSNGRFDREDFYCEGHLVLFRPFVEELAKLCGPQVGYSDYMFDDDRFVIASGSVAKRPAKRSAKRPSKRAAKRTAKTTTKQRRRA
jgi:hypothetical protein